MVLNYTNAVLAISLRVQPGDSPQPLDIVVKQAVPITQMARVQPGATVVVKLDPKDRTKAIIDWQASAYLGVNATVAPMTGAPMAGAPMAGAPMAGAPMAGAPMTGQPGWSAGQ
jgi:hypothetical protein